jgi:hypothetical protein
MKRCCAAHAVSDVLIEMGAALDNATNSKRRFCHELVAAQLPNTVSVMAAVH